MRFQRYGRYAYVATPRKSAAILRRQQRERDAMPLFADQVASEQRSVSEEHCERTQRWRLSEIESRRHRAAQWRAARAALNALPHADRLLLQRHWNYHRWLPATPEYLLSMLRMYERQQLDLSAPGMTVSTRQKPSTWSTPV